MKKAINEFHNPFSWFLTGCDFLVEEVYRIFVLDAALVDWEYGRE
jgi:hypothetical protein